jgi:hypothetical protein
MGSIQAAAERARDLSTINPWGFWITTSPQGPPLLVQFLEGLAAQQPQHRLHLLARRPPGPRPVIPSLLAWVLVIHRHDRHLHPCLLGVQENRERWTTRSPSLSGYEERFLPGVASDLLQVVADYKRLSAVQAAGDGRASGRTILEKRRTSADRSYDPARVAPC